MPATIDEKLSHNLSPEVIIEDASTIYIDPEKEKACLRKFDKFFMPQAFIFLVLNYLDRSNVSVRNHLARTYSANELNSLEMLLSSDSALIWG